MQVVKESTAKRDIWKRYAALAANSLSRQLLTARACRKVEQVSEETDALRLAIDKHTGRQYR